MVKAEGANGAGGDDDFEARLAALKRAKGETPYGEGKAGSSRSERKKAAAAGGVAAAGTAVPAYDYTNETLHFESGPHGGDLAINLALGTTLLWLPLTLAAVGRSAFVKYRFTDRRLSCITSAPWKNEQLDAAYQEVRDVVTIGRGIGLWGDMLITLRNGDKIEMRALPKHKELKEYILKRRDELRGGKSASAGGSAPKAETSPSPKGFSA